MAREVLAAVVGASRLFLTTVRGMRRARRILKRGVKSFEMTLVGMGVRKDHAREIARAFGSPGEQLLSLRNLLRTFSRSDGAFVYVARHASQREQGTSHA